jgi:hypothetical protein
MPSVPVRVAPSDVDGLLGQIVRIDLVGPTREEAKAALLAGLGPGRAKPVTKPAFPGRTTGLLQLRWRDDPRLTGDAYSSHDPVPAIQELALVFGQRRSGKRRGD